MSVPRIRCLGRLAVLLVALAATPAYADLAGLPAQPAPLTAPQQGLVANNPDIADLQADHPWVVRAILRQLANPVPDARDASPTTAPTLTDAPILNANPALGQLWRSNPDATLSLLRLIRTAGQTGATRAGTLN